MVDITRPRLTPIHTVHHARNGSIHTLDSDSSESSPIELDDDRVAFTIHFNDSQSTIGPLTLKRDGIMDLDMDYVYRTSPVQKLPAELLITIFTKLTTTGDLRNCMLVSYAWAVCAVNILWHRPLCNKWNSLVNVANTLSRPLPTFPYHDMVKRLNLAAIADKVNDGTVSAFFNCKAVERLTLTSCVKLTDQSVEGLVTGTKRLQALDVTDLEHLTDKSILKVARNCPKLQGLNVTNCSAITDDSLCQIAIHCTQLKRLKLNGVMRVTDESILQVARYCRSILEIDLMGCHSVGSASITALLMNLPQLRELRLAGCIGLDNRAFTDLHPDRRFDALRILDLTACDGIGDEAIGRIIPAAPRLRNLVLAKCRHITDVAVRAICSLTKNLHYIHLGHCQNLTDQAVIDLVQQCNRIRYIDLACCSRLTDVSVRHLARLPKLRRIGLVKCQNLTDASIIALARGPYTSVVTKAGMSSQFVSLERVHLSYCTSLTLKGITELLLNCPRLTHLSLTGVQAFLRDDLTRFCREPPNEFTHTQRDVFCVFSGEGVVRLRDYLARLAIEEQERDLQQQGAVDEPVVGPNSPDADSMSDGTIDGTDQPYDFVLGPGRAGLPRVTQLRARPRPRSLQDLTGVHVDMPLLPGEQMTQFGPWTPSGPLTPDMRAQMAPPHLNLINSSIFGAQAGEASFTRHRSPLATPRLTPSGDAYSQSRRHTVESSDGFFGHTPTSVPRQQQDYLETEMFDYSHMQLPIFHSSVHGAPPPLATPGHRSVPNRFSLPNPNQDMSSFEVNHDAILSTIPDGSRGPSRPPSRSNSPHMTRVMSRSRLSNFLGNVRALSSSPLSHNSAEASGGRGGWAAVGARSASSVRREESARQEMARALVSSDSQELLRPELYHTAVTSERARLGRDILPRARMPHLPPELLDLPSTPMTPGTPVNGASPPVQLPERRAGPSLAPEPRAGTDTSSRTAPVGMVVRDDRPAGGESRDVDMS